MVDLFGYGDPERGCGYHSVWLPYFLSLMCMDLDILSPSSRLFERVIKLKLSSKKMKFFFKKYLDFEKSKGTAQGVEHVKQAAVAYVEGLQRE